MGDGDETVTAPGETTKTTRDGGPDVRVYPTKTLWALVEEYLKDFDLPEALVRAGYPRLNTVSETNERAKRVQESQRFRALVQAAVKRLELSTYAAVAREGKGTASLQAAEKLRDAVDKMEREGVDNQVGKARWGRKPGIPNK
ncbi:MAG: hypothetical protein R6U98_06655 [Pirellulaceae bacterium]